MGAFSLIVVINLLNRLICKMSDSAADALKDPKMQSFIQKATQMEQLNSIMQELTSRCWDMCVADTKISTSLSGRTESCIENCVERFVDANKVIVDYVASKGQAGGVSGFR